MESNVNKDVKTNEVKAKFSDDKHARRLLAALNVGRNDAHLCDGVVIIGDSRINVQKAVLAAASHYFRSVFSYETNGTTKSDVDLTAMEITLDTFETILDYIYTSEIKLCEENIQDILMASDVLLLGELKDICCEYLEGCITPHNCLGIFEFTGRFTCPWVHLKVTQYIDEHIKLVVDTEEFMKLNKDALISLVTRFTININEDEYLKCILSWCEYNKDEQRAHIGRILRACFPNMSPDTFDYEGCDMERWLAELSQKISVGDQLPRGQCDVILVCGGEENVNFDEHESYNQVINSACCFVPPEYTFHHGLCKGKYDNSKWRRLAPMLTPRIGHGLVECGGCAYAIGGRGSDGSITNTAEMYDPQRNKWIPIADMLEERVHFGIVAIKDNIYVLGGSRRFVDPFPTMEVYNIFSNTWRMLPEMNIRRHGFSCVASDNKIFVIGGASKADLFDSVECFDISTETWHSASPLREKRFNGKAVGTLDGDIYLFGGMRRIECPSAMMHGGGVKYCGSEVFSKQAGTWNQVRQCTSHYQRLCANLEKTQVDSVVAIGDVIYVIGKIDYGTPFQTTIRGYDIRTQTWFNAVDIPLDSRSPLTACVVKIPTFVMV